MMQILIDIPEEVYEKQRYSQYFGAWSAKLQETIESGVPIDVLDKIRTELHITAEMHEDGEYYLRDEWIGEIFDKYTGRK